MEIKNLTKHIAAAPGKMIKAVTQAPAKLSQTVASASHDIVNLSSRACDDSAHLVVEQSKRLKAMAIKNGNLARAGAPAESSPRTSSSVATDGATRSCSHKRHELAMVMTPQNNGNEPATGTGHVWLEIRNEGGEIEHSVGTSRGPGLKSPDGHATDSVKYDIKTWPLTATEAHGITNYYQRLEERQKPDQWYANPTKKQEYLKPYPVLGRDIGLKTLDLEKFNVCSTVAVKLVDLALRNDDKYPRSRLGLPQEPILQPNNLWNHYHPDDPLPKGEFQFQGLVSPP